nr:c-type cytochrome [Profundibacter amoris]
MRLALLLGCVLAARIALGEPAGNADSGHKLARQCRTCHGINGYAKIPIAPHIGGETAGYIARQLTSFREGRRSHEMMSVIASGLTDTDIRDLAAWYASIPIRAALPDGADTADAPIECTGCHGSEGIAVIPEAPNLAGESLVYIETQLKAFRVGKRQHPDMNRIAAGLSDEDIRTVARWYTQINFAVLP